MTTRRDLIVLLGAVALAPRSALAQSNEPPARSGRSVRVGMLSEATRATAELAENRFIDAMLALGWVEARNVVYDRAYADDDAARLPEVAAGLVARRPDAIYVRATQPALAVSARTRTIPIIFAGVSDPEQSGLVKSLARPGGNVTGVSPIGADLGGKRLHLAKQALPALSRIGVLVNPTYSAVSSKDYKQVEEAAARLGVTVIPAMVSTTAELDTAFALFSKSRVQAVLSTQNPLLSVVASKRILELAAAARLPLIATGAGHVANGALMSYSALASEQFHRSALMVDKVLKGASPADIPVELPTKFELVVNLKTAKALGLTIPQPFLMRADRVIE